MISTGLCTELSTGGKGKGTQNSWSSVGPSSPKWRAFVGIHFDVYDNSVTEYFHQLKYSVTEFF